MNRPYGLFPLLSFFQSSFPRITRVACCRFCFLFVVVVAVVIVVVCVFVLVRARLLACLLRIFSTDKILGFINTFIIINSQS